MFGLSKLMRSKTKLIFGEVKGETLSFFLFLATNLTTGNDPNEDLVNLFSLFALCQIRLLLKKLE